MNLVRAAGGLVIRSEQTPAAVEVLLVHRARYNDWSFPKGKLDKGESFEDAALREVAEETGLVCRLNGELDRIRYLDAAGRPKIVRYWRMIPVDGDIGDFVLNDEIDGVRWVPAEEARNPADLSARSRPSRRLGDKRSGSVPEIVARLGGSGRVGIVGQRNTDAIFRSGREVLEHPGLGIEGVFTWAGLETDIGVVGL